MQLSKLRGVLAENNITQAKLAVIWGVTEKTVSAKLNGKAPITIDEANKLVKSIDIVNPEAIFFG